MDSRPIVVIGAGLAGLSCATRLIREGFDVVVVEASDAVGGRMRTDRVDGFVIDRGFQVLNTAYPALRRVLDSENLELRPLPRGVRLRRGGTIEELPHPMSSPTAPLRAAMSGITNMRGKVALSRYVGRLLLSSPAALRRRPDVAADQAWRGSLPDQVVDDVLVPFMSGVVLEPTIWTSRVFTDLMMRAFALGTSAIPAAGMQSLPDAMAARLPVSTVRFDSPVATVSRNSVGLADGAAIDASAVVVATDPWTAYRLVPALGDPPEARAVTTYYHAAAPWPGLQGALVLDGDVTGVLNSVVLTASAPEYSTDGRALIATSVLHADGAPGGPGGPRLDAAQAQQVASELHGCSGEKWELIATRSIPQALPAMPAPLEMRKPAYVPDPGVWVAGDHRDTSSIQGALVSGARIAAAVTRASHNATPAGVLG